ncbi:MAG: hypothetical protein Q8L35_07450 [Actinomycetota bacterium]|nr:hypothetical protein [Actinomycetota bacterium]
MTTLADKPWLGPWFGELIESYKHDDESVYHTWFTDAERLKYFGAIRRGVQNWFWKPKLRIPDIYENPANKRESGECLEYCLATSSEKKLLEVVADLAA